MKTTMQTNVAAHLSFEHIEDTEQYSVSPEVQYTVFVLVMVKYLCCLPLKPVVLNWFGHGTTFSNGNQAATQFFI